MSVATCPLSLVLSQWDRIIGSSDHRFIAELFDRLLAATNNGPRTNDNGLGTITFLFSATFALTNDKDIVLYNIQGDPQSVENRLFVFINIQGYPFIFAPFLSDLYRLQWLYLVALFSMTWPLAA